VEKLASTIGRKLAATGCGGGQTLFGPLDTKIGVRDGSHPILGVLGGSGGLGYAQHLLVLAFAPVFRRHPALSGKTPEHLAMRSETADESNFFDLSGLVLD